MKQFNWWFPAKKVIAPQLPVFPQTQTHKPFLSNFDFEVRLLISRKEQAPVYMQVKSFDNVYGSLLIPKQTTQRLDNFCRQTFYFVKHYISFSNQKLKALKFISCIF